jgi:hypothetical protein
VEAMKAVTLVAVHRPLMSLLGRRLPELELAVLDTQYNSLHFSLEAVR